nr:probable methyltransferase PMT26 [Tanacetum cinerariifolium]
LAAMSHIIRERTDVVDAAGNNTTDVTELNRLLGPGGYFVWSATPICQKLPEGVGIWEAMKKLTKSMCWEVKAVELNRLLGPGGYFDWSATPICQKLLEGVGIWEAMKKLTKSMCWEVKAVGKDKVNKVGVAVYQKSMANEYNKMSLHSARILMV